MREGDADYIVRGPTGMSFFDSLSEGEERAVDNYDELKRHIDCLDSPERHIGGSSVNAIRALRGLDADLRLSLVGPLGKLPVGFSLQELEGIDLTGVVPFSGPANACVSVVNGVERKLRPFNSPSGVRALLGDRREETIRNLARAALVHVTSLLVPKAAQDVGELLDEVKGRSPDTRFSVDLGLPWSEDHGAAQAVLRHASRLVLGQDELRALIPRTPQEPTRAQEQEAIDELLRTYSCPADTVVVLKRRALPEAEPHIPRRRKRVGGVMYHRDPLAPAQLVRDEVLRDALDDSQVVDSTGAGDFFASAVLADAVSVRLRAVQTLALATAMARHKFGHTPTTAFRSIPAIRLGEAQPASAGKVFISHAHADRDLVQALLRVLSVGCTDPSPCEFFCSSQPTTAVPYGYGLEEEIVANLRCARWVLFVVTPHFEASRACQREVGGTQVLGVPGVPLLHPDLDFEDVRFPFARHTGVSLDDESSLSRLHGDIAEHFGWRRFSLDDWRERFAALRAVVSTTDGAQAQPLEAGASDSPTSG